VVSALPVVGCADREDVQHFARHRLSSRKKKKTRCSTLLNFSAALPSYAMYASPSLPAASDKLPLTPPICYQWGCQPMLVILTPGSLHYLTHRRKRDRRPIHNIKAYAGRHRAHLLSTPDSATALVGKHDRREDYAYSPRRRY
jgi:hypothetical protein